MTIACMTKYEWILLMSSLYLKYSFDLIGGDKHWFNQLLVFCSGATWISTFCLYRLFGELTPSWCISRGTTVLLYLKCFYKSDHPFKNLVIKMMHYESLQHWYCCIGSLMHLLIYTEGIPSPCSSMRNTLDCCNLEIWKPSKLCVFNTMYNTICTRCAQKDAVTHYWFNSL